MTGQSKMPPHIICICNLEKKYDDFPPKKINDKTYLYNFNLCNNKGTGKYNKFREQINLCYEKKGLVELYFRNGNGMYKYYGMGTIEEKKINKDKISYKLITQIEENNPKYIRPLNKGNNFRYVKPCLENSGYTGKARQCPCFYYF